MMSDLERRDENLAPLGLTLSSIARTATKFQWNIGSITIFDGDGGSG